MKVRRLKVGVRPLEEGLQEFGGTLKDLQTGKILSKRGGVYFVSVVHATGAHALTHDLAPPHQDSSSSFDCLIGETDPQGLQKCPWSI